MSETAPRVRIKSLDGTPGNTLITAPSGEPIMGVVGISWRLGVDRASKATVELELVEIETLATVAPAQVAKAAAAVAISFERRGISGSFADHQAVALAVLRAFCRNSAT